MQNAAGVPTGAGANNRIAISTTFLARPLRTGHFLRSSVFVLVKRLFTGKPRRQE
ncbi:MAG: hypothetical protein ACLRP3_08155 [Escherichia sp.]